MKFKKLGKKVFCVLSIVMLGVAGGTELGFAASMKDVLSFSFPSLGVLNYDYEEQAKEIGRAHV